MANVFDLRYGDTGPGLEVQVLDDGEPYDATGATEHRMYIRLDNGQHLVRNLQATFLASGIFRYTPVASDWDPGSSGDGSYDDPFAVGGLSVSVNHPDERGPKHRLEYEIIGPSPLRRTFPTRAEDNDILYITADLGQEG